MKKEQEIIKKDATIRIEDNLIRVSLQCDCGDGLKWYAGIIYNQKETAISMKEKLLANGFKSVTLLNENN